MGTLPDTAERKEMESVCPCEQTETVTEFKQVSKLVAVEAALIKPR
jgi:hypothetical protein